jgi:hypothetical protein
LLVDELEGKPRRTLSPDGDQAPLVSFGAPQDFGYVKALRGVGEGLLLSFCGGVDRLLSLAAGQQTKKYAARNHEGWNEL